MDSIFGLSGGYFFQEERLTTGQDRLCKARFHFGKILE
jgi:hypothetical protein